MPFIALTFFLQLTRGVFLFVFGMVCVRPIRIHSDGYGVTQFHPQGIGQGNGHPPAASLEVKVDFSREIEVDLGGGVVMIVMLCPVSMGRGMGRRAALVRRLSTYLDTCPREIACA